mmetsp:Transcript_435/g.966  ORF Transcript_435/g.966 Transcript_435/m.966 type:complete len:454 (-) Transcript_435:152-1513(-)|eukprot:CAMPEP_0201867836 /NCGR_PEP_ID=MMETSP0902-20130614/1949_1 /ASSEMBLY_ACC=CAM_ASM_000551 /TAXON_ID=420261 /ORGANISM="Thalassiosira antarctica, Strain CCMP982" /LENGTH=453 /DNA_ID=CAMNT_0048393085 /DNA_START=38 /DNA_END=1399 /DNA_ORIENTATION=-
MAGPAGRPKKRKFPPSAAAADDNEASSSPAAEESQESATAGQEEVDLHSAELKSDNDDGATHSSADAEETNHAKKQPPPPNPYDAIRRAIVINDGSRQNLIRLIGLKSLFAKQLPKMPKEYIARLVFDRRHKSLALLSNDPNKKDCDEEIIGGICYRAYPEMRFAEIAFCAVSASQQVKGYGTKLMNLFKMHAVTEGIEYFITYADNYAIGYFKKQGFTKAVQMPKGRYQGLIKDYDGGTIMECYVHPTIDFTRVHETIAAQRQFLLERIRATTSKSDKVVHPPLPPDFADTLETAARGTNKAAERALAIPGVVEAGWTMSDLISMTRGTKDSDQKKHQLKSELMSLVNKVSDQQFAWCFRDPVNVEEVKDYLNVISEPMDLRTMEKRIRKGDWYKNKHMLYSDMMKMVNNCKLYNGEGSTYCEYAVSLEKYLATIFPKRVTSAAVLDGGGEV